MPACTRFTSGMRLAVRMRRRDWLASAAGASLTLRDAAAQVRSAAGTILLPTLPSAAPLPDAVLFGFDTHAFPFQDQVEVRLVMGQRPTTVLTHGPPGSPDEVLLYYGSVIRNGDTLHMWYTGNHGPLANHIGYELRDCYLCYA